MAESDTLERFDDERITRGLVTNDEISALEKTLLRMYLEKANAHGKTVVVTTDRAEYDARKRSGDAFDGPNLYLLMDSQRSTVLDMALVAFHLIDTPEGLFYAKLMPQQKYCPS